MAAGGTTRAAVCALTAAILLAGCQRTVSGLDTRGRLEPLPPAPVSSVEVAALDPAGPQQLPTPTGPLEPEQPALGADGLPQGDVVAAVDPVDPAPAPVGEPLTREGMAGTWTVDSDNPECRIILAFTKWSGGYRAATRRCTTDELAAVSAWDVRDNRVVLVDSGGNQIAALYSAGPERYEGATAGGKKVTFSR